ncbi:MAG: ABC transporter permease [Hamadaea sp.]|uniref:ABC transporter permease n=1 Tax=Hamadaea sp. TaxID=2024425 RepID=UPI0018198424|nr:ABC transporter permease [Hamadaea sp.]NUR73399.1 ABC transporter permease [Hamadaea sp.]NUT18546.1 ABC transporter permease [Hamadaea sp.]
MIALASLRQRWRSLLGTTVTLAIAVALLTICGLLLTSAGPVLPDRYAAAPALVRPIPPTDPEAFTEPRPWSADQADALALQLTGITGVDRVVPEHRFYAQLIRYGKPVGEVADASGWSAAALGGYSVTAGRIPEKADEVVVDSGLGIAPGSAVTLLTARGPETFTVSGTADGPGLWVGDALARERAGGVRVIGVLGTRSVDPAKIADVVGSDGEVLTGSQRAALEPVADARTRWIGMQVLLAVSALGAFVSVFIVASAFAFATRRRHRELALLRLLGAAPRQIRRMIHGEVLLVGLAGGLAGAPLGLATAALVGRWLVRTGFEPRTFVIAYQLWVPIAAIAAGMLVSLAGAIAAAWRAARVSPLDALRESALDDRPMSRMRWVTGLLAVAVAGLFGVAATSASGADLGTYALYAAMALTTAGSLLAPAILPFAVRLLTAPFARDRGATVLLVRQHTRTAARRTASTAAPILLSVAFAVLVGGLVQTSTASYGIGRVAAAGAAAVVVPDGVPGLSDAAVTAATGLSTLPTTVYSGSEPLAAAGISAAEDSLFTIGSGDLTAIHRPGPRIPIAVTNWYADQAGWQLGSTHPVTAVDGRAYTLLVAAVVTKGPTPASVLLDRDTVRKLDSSALTASVYRTASGASGLTGLGARELSGAAYAQSTADEDDRLVWVFTVILIAVSAGFGLLAVVNTTMMASAARAGDLRLLRLSGATRTQVLGMLSAETATVVVVGGGLGLGVAVAALAALARGLSAQLGATVPMVVPWTTLGVTVGLCLALAVLSTGAALMFGDRARRLLA